MTSKELREKRKRLHEEARGLLAKPDFSAEDQTKVDQIFAEMDSLKSRIDAMERSDELEASFAAGGARRRIESEGRGAGVGNREEEEPEADEFQTWLRGDARVNRLGVTSERNILLPDRRMTPEQRAAALVERRAQSTSTTAGGYTIAEDFSYALEVAMLAYGGTLQVATVMRTDTGAALPWPTLNDTTNEGVLLAENTQETEQALVFAVKQLDAYKYSSRIVLASVEILQDSAFDFNGVVATALGERLGRILNRHLTVGTGSGQPNGIVTASAAGATAAASGAIAFNDLVDLEHSVDPAYRTGARFMLHDTTLKLIKQLKDSQNRPLWLPGLAVREPDTILGYPYTVNQHMATALSTLGKAMIFGRLDKYVARIVREITLLRLVERYADYLQVGFIAFMRADGELIDAGTNPVKHLVMPSP